jgi:hypothetical protein
MGMGSLMSRQQTTAASIAISAMGDGSFQNALISNVGTLDLEGGLGDFNGDGKLDLIGVSGTQLAWFQGNGDGTFQTPSTYYSVGADTRAIIAADLNGDGKLDLITVQSSPTNTFTVLLGNGDGTFQLGVPDPLGSNLGGGIIGDFNAEGKLDLVLSDEAGTLSTLPLAREWRRYLSKPAFVAERLACRCYGGL